MAEGTDRRGALLPMRVTFAASTSITSATRRSPARGGRRRGRRGRGRAFRRGRLAADERRLGLVARREVLALDLLATVDEDPGHDDVEALRPVGGGAVRAVDVLDAEVADAGTRTRHGAHLV